MTQNCLMAAALLLAAPVARRLGARLPAGGRRPEYALADLVEHPAILLEMRCREGDRHSLERLLECLTPQEARAMPPLGSEDRGPAFFH